DGSSAGSPKEACVAASPPPAPAPVKRDVRHHHPHSHPQHVQHQPHGQHVQHPQHMHHEQHSRPLSIEMRVSPGGAGPSADPPHMMHHHHMDTNPLEGSVESMVSGAGSSDGELSSKAGDSPSRKRRRISRHLSSGNL
ncbi:hypothetical protein HF086_007765, partial [Spodoptera exigua]